MTIKHKSPQYKIKPREHAYGHTGERRRLQSGFEIV